MRKDIMTHPMEKDWLSYDERKSYTDGLWDLHDGNDFITTNKYDIILGGDLP